MIIATAGHIDHGKTLLIKALTGIDTDRLPEEKRREMTIDLGFAYLPLAGDRSIAFIDVPGHERFIRNMLCGVAAIDFVLLVVAADDGPMPQTEEHLAILDLLGVERGAVALTKTDRVDQARIAVVSDAILNRLGRTTLAQAPVFAVSAATGAGVEALKAHLMAIASEWQARKVEGRFRLAVDRCFHVVGAGVVATGTAFAGALTVGDEVRLLSSERTLRVRGIHANNRRAETCQAGQRCALNLSGPGLSKDAVSRGDWIVAGAAAPPMRKIDATLRVIAGERRPLAHWTPVHVHLAAAEATGRIALLEGRALAPGQSGLIQLRLDRAIGACHGDRLIVRDQSARRTIGGGRVVDIFPPARGRARPGRLAALAVMEAADPGAALAGLLALEAQGVDLAYFEAARNLTPDEAAALYVRIPCHRIEAGRAHRGFAPDHWKRLRQGALDLVARHHSESPASRGLAPVRLVTKALQRLAPETGPALADELVAQGELVREGALLRLPTHQQAVDPAEAALWDRVASCLDAAGLGPQTVHDLAAALGEEPAKLERLLGRGGRKAVAIRVGTNRFFRPAALQQLGVIAETLAAEAPDGLFTARVFRDRAKIGRNLTIEVLEYFDGRRFTRRVGDARKVLRPLGDLFSG